MILLDGIIFDLQQRGGISVYFDQIVEGIAERKISGTKLLVSPKAALDHSQKRSHPPTIEFKPRILERMRKPPLLNNMDEGGVFLSSYYRRPPNKKFKSVVTVHDFIHRRFGKGAYNRAFVIQQALAIKNADILICVSHSTQRDLYTFFPQIDRNSVYVIHNGVSDAYFPLNHVLREDRVIYVGSRATYKNFEFAAKSMANLDHYMFDIVGGGRLTKEELHLLNQNCPGRFEHHASPSEDELNFLYNRSRFLFYLSEYEGFGIPPLEAMRAGCIPLVKHSSSLPEVVGEGGQFVGDTPEEVASRAFELSRSDEFSRVQLYGYKQASKFAWQSCRNKTIDLIQNVKADSVKSGGSLT